MKVIFLDFDGVITVPETKWHLSTIHMKRLGKILDATGASIIVSSSWRYGGIERLLENITDPNYFLCRPLESNPNIGTFLYPEKIIDVTPTIIMGKPSYSETGVDRGYEIDAWLRSNKHFEIESYLIIDDDSDFLEEQKKHFVHTNYRKGLTEENVEQAIKLLNEYGK